MKKFTLFFLIFFLYINIYPYTYIYGIKEFELEFDKSIFKTPLNQSLFFKTIHNTPEIYLNLEYDDNYIFENGVRFIEVKYMDKLHWGFDYSEESLINLNRKLTGLKYFISDATTISAGFQTGKRKQETLKTSKDTIIYFLNETDIIENTENILLDGLKLGKNIDYFIDYSSGILTLNFYPPPESELYLSYSSYSTSKPYPETYSRINFKNNNIDLNFSDSETQVMYYKNNLNINWIYLNELSTFYSTVEYKQNNYKLGLNLFREEKKNYKPYIGFTRNFELEYNNFHYINFKNKNYYKFNNADWNISFMERKKEKNYFKFNYSALKNNIYSDIKALYINKEEYNFDSSFSIRKNKLSYYQQDIFSDKKYYTKRRQINFYLKNYRVYTTYINSEIKSGISKAFRNFNILLEKSNRSSSKVQTRYINNNFNFYFTDYINKSYSLVFKNNIYSFKFSKTEGKPYSAGFTLNKDNFRIKTEFLKGSGANVNFKNSGNQKFFEIEYNTDDESGSVSYNIILN
ncbi:MAG: hypothetical protein ACQESP_08340 [Candidatus Muiribacteriota bacterium]